MLTVDFGDEVLQSVKNGDTVLVEDTDYTVGESSITLEIAYLATLSVGVETVSLNFNVSTFDIVVTVSDTTA